MRASAPEVPRILTELAGAAAISLALFLPVLPRASATDAHDAGRELAFARDKGNCLACHQMRGGSQMGTLGPRLENMRQRYPNRQALAAKIYDATADNPASLMPPFGRHRILSRDDIDVIVEFLYSL